MTIQYYIRIDIYTLFHYHNNCQKYYFQKINRFIICDKVEKRYKGVDQIHGFIIIVDTSICRHVLMMLLLPPLTACASVLLPPINTDKLFVFRVQPGCGCLLPLVLSSQ